jgi:hypothetical protein
MASVPRLTWRDADRVAALSIPSLLAYARRWDANALAAGNASADCPF